MGRFVASGKKSLDTCDECNHTANMAFEGTPTQRLADQLLGRPLADYVTEKRTARPQWSWQLIAEQLAEDTDGQVAVTREALRTWYGENAA